jgi:hypothetical protein
MGGGVIEYHSDGGDIVFPRLVYPERVGHDAL